MNYNGKLKFDVEKFKQAREVGGYSIIEVGYAWNMGFEYVERVENGVIEPSIRELELFLYMVNNSPNIVLDDSVSSITIADFYGGKDIAEEEMLINDFILKNNWHIVKEVISKHFSTILGVEVSLLEIDRDYWIFGADIMLSKGSEIVWYLFTARVVDKDKGILKVKMPNREFIRKLWRYVSVKTRIEEEYKKGV